MSEENFADGCKQRFIELCQARDIAPFHKDKDEFARQAWLEVDAYLDWLDLQEL